MCIVMASPTIITSSVCLMYDASINIPIVHVCCILILYLK